MRERVGRQRWPSPRWSGPRFSRHPSGEVRRAPPPAPTEHWALEEGYAGIERAQLVIVNVRSDTDHLAADSVVAEVEQLRKDAEIYRDVVGVRGNKLPITAVVADLANPKDPGLKKAAARVKRATKRRQP